jgi:hypothetical protein
MMRRRKFAGVLYLFVLVVSLIRPSLTVAAGDPIAGEVLFNTLFTGLSFYGPLSCSTSGCHGGYTGANNPNNVKNGANNPTIIQNAINNNSGGMGVFSGKFSTTDLEDIAAYIANPTAAAPGEITLDNAPAGVQDAAGGRTFSGSWCTSGVSGSYGAASLYSCGGGADVYRFTPKVSNPHTFDVYVRWTANGNRSTQTPISVTHSAGTTTRQFNQRLNGGQWVLHGRYNFSAGTGGNIQIKGSNGQASADAVKLIPAQALTTGRLTVSVSGGGRGIVSSSPAGINCGIDCVQDYAIGTNVTMTATPAAGSAFSDWGGSCSGNGVCHIIINGNKSVAADFRLQAIVDNAAAGVQDAAGGRTFSGSWCTSKATGAYGPSSLYSCGGIADIYRFTPNVPSTGTYDVYVRWTANANRSTRTPITVTYAGGANSKQFNQQINGSQWVLHGRYNFNAGTAGRIEISGASGEAAADAVRLLSVP